MSTDIDSHTSGSAIPQAELHPDGAGFGVRAAARTIDVIVYLAVWFFTSIVAGIGVGIYAVMANVDSRLLTDKLGTTHWYAYVLSAMGAVLYQTLMEGTNGASVGKRLLGLIVISTNGQPVRLPAAMGRSLAFYLDGLFFGLVAYSSMEPPLQQRYGDKWCNTVVVKRSTLPTQAGVPRTGFGLAPQRSARGQHLLSGFDSHCTRLTILNYASERPPGPGYQLPRTRSTSLNVTLGHNPPLSRDGRSDAHVHSAPIPRFLAYSHPTMPRHLAPHARNAI